MSAPALPAEPLSRRSLDLAVVAVWALLLGAVLGWPWFVPLDSPGDYRTRATVRVALAYYAAALALMLTLRREEWAAVSGRGRLARWCWALAWVTYAVHVGVAFHHYHHWSHANAVRHTREVSGVGEGVYVSYLFSLLWALDVAWWWLRPAAYASRPAWVDRLLHGLMAFIVFCGTVVYESGPIRWAGVVLFAGLALALLARRQRWGPFARLGPAA
jgi:hypothetical protein